MAQSERSTIRARPNCACAHAAWNPDKSRLGRDWPRSPRKQQVQPRHPGSPGHFIPTPKFGISTAPSRVAGPWSRLPTSHQFGITSFHNPSLEQPNDESKMGAIINLPNRDQNGSSAHPKVPLGIRPPPPKAGSQEVKNATGSCWCDPTSPSMPSDLALQESKDFLIQSPGRSPSHEASIPPAVLHSACVSSF